MDGKVGSEDRDHTAPSSENSEEARLATLRASQESRTRPLQQTLDFTIGYLHRLSFEPKMASRRREPAPERLVVMPWSVSQVLPLSPWRFLG
jgi:hypothetical protein